MKARMSKAFVLILADPGAKEVFQQFMGGGLGVSFYIEALDRYLALPPRRGRAWYNGPKAPKGAPDTYVVKVNDPVADETRRAAELVRKYSAGEATYADVTDGLQRVIAIENRYSSNPLRRWYQRFVDYWNRPAISS
jgi:hypothetical protein